MAPIKPHYPDLVAVQFSDATSFSSYLTTLHDLRDGHTLVTLPSSSGTLTKAYTSVQVAASQHIELGNEFVYMNHSCDPNVHLVLGGPNEVGGCIIQVVTHRAIAKDEPLTFDYCTTEWDMEQPFACTCGAKSCRRRIQGAKHLSLEQVKRLVGVTPHILALKETK